MIFRSRGDRCSYVNGDTEVDQLSQEERHNLHSVSCDFHHHADPDVVQIGERFNARKCLAPCTIGRCRIIALLVSQQEGGRRHGRRASVLRDRETPAH